MYHQRIEQRVMSPLEYSIVSVDVSTDQAAPHFQCGEVTG